MWRGGCSVRRLCSDCISRITWPVFLKRWVFCVVLIWWMFCGVLVAFLGHLASLREEVGVLFVGCVQIAFPGSPGQFSWRGGCSVSLWCSYCISRMYCLKRESQWKQEVVLTWGGELSTHSVWNSETEVVTKTGGCFDLRSVGGEGRGGGSFGGGGQGGGVSWGGGGLEVLASSFSPNTFCLIEKSQELNILAGS